MSDKIHFKGLNGLRAIAASSVILEHTGGDFDKFGLEKKLWLFASFDVTMFFALSGFLITYLLLIEKKRFARISIRKFYIRRVLRIWPIYFLYLALALLTTWIYSPNLLPGSVGWYLILAANVPFALGTFFPLLVHYWSLGVEEQFYIFWPLLVQKSRNVFRNVSIFLVAWLALKMIGRLVQIKTGNVTMYTFIHVTRFDCMAIGALSAVMLYEKKQWFLNFCYHPVVQIATWMLLILFKFRFVEVFSIIDEEIFAMLTAIIILNVATNPRSIIKLNGRIFDFLGQISFGMYVYHMLVIFFLSKIIGTHLNFLPYYFQGTLIFFIILLATILISYLSYRFYEKRFLVLKHKFVKVESAP